MKLRHLRTFVTVAEQGTVAGAALRLRIAQPALSRQISDLESELGISLFDRVRRRLILTSQGEELLAHCRTVLGAVHSLEEQAQVLRRGDRGVLSSADIRRCVPAGGREAQCRFNEPRAAYAARAGRSGPWRRNSAVRGTHETLSGRRGADPPCAQAAARYVCRFLGQTPRSSAVCGRFLRLTRGPYTTCFSVVQTRACCDETQSQGTTLIPAGLPYVSSITSSST